MGGFDLWGMFRGGIRGIRVGLEIGVIKGKVYFWFIEVLILDFNFLGFRVLGN